MVEHSISSDSKASIGVQLTLLAPPCEFEEVLNDVRSLAGGDITTEKALSVAAAQYNRDQFISVILPNAKHRSLLSVYGDLGGGRFLCPRMHVSFCFDHLNHTVSDIQSLPPDNADGGDVSAEIWRSAVESAVTSYTSEHFPGGAVAVYAPAVKDSDRRLIICFESHFAKSHSTGRWRSEWTVTMPSGSAKEFPVHGIIKVQTHMFEEGNVQLVSSKQISFVIPAPDPTTFATSCVRLIKEQHITYQVAVAENLQNMSEATFKVLRRRLPLTRSKLEWDKIITYQIGSELTKAS